MQERRELGHFAASEEEIQSAPCTRKTPFTKEEIQEWLDSYGKKQGDVTTTTVHGVRFENENPALVQAFRKLVEPEDEQEQPDTKFHPWGVPDDCKKVDCAVKGVFGEKRGLQLLFMMVRYGFNGSHYSYSYSDPFLPSELDDVLLALSDLPSTLVPVSPSKRLTRYFQRSVRPGLYRDRSLANSMIEVFDLWSAQRAPRRRYVITHELGHYLAGEIKADESPEWLKLGGWKKATEIANGERLSEWQRNEDALVSRYAAEKPREDFAESVAAYRYNPKLLKERSPGKYAYIRETIFDGVEYDTEESCSNPKTKSGTRDVPGIKSSFQLFYRDFTAGRL